MSNTSEEVEVRGFSFIKEIFDERGWSMPVKIKIEKECTPLELASKLDLPVEKIEAVFINGKARAVDKAGMVKGGDRVAFVPYGTPGPYRAILGLAEVPDKGD